MKRHSIWCATFRASEAACEDINVYSPSQVRTAVVHTREDMALLCSLVSSLNQSSHWIFGALVWVFGLLVLNAVILGYIAFRRSHNGRAVSCRAAGPAKENAGNPAEGVVPKGCDGDGDERRRRGTARRRDPGLGEDGPAFPASRSLG